MFMTLRPDQTAKIQAAIQAGWIGHESDLLDLGLSVLFAQSAPAPSAQTPRQAADRIRSLRKGKNLPQGMSLHDLIHEGRA